MSRKDQRSGELPTGFGGAALLFGRASLGVYFALAGIAKVQGGVSRFVEGRFHDATPSWLPEIVATAYGHALPFLELAVGAALALGFAGRIAAAGCAAMLASFLIAFGVSGGSGPYDKNVVFLGLALVLVVTGPGSLSLDRMLRRR